MFTKLILLGSLVFVAWVFYFNHNKSATIQTYQEKKEDAFIQNETKDTLIQPQDLRRNLSLPENRKQIKINKTKLGELTAQILSESYQSKLEFESVSYLNFEDKFKEFEFSYYGEIDDNIVMLAGLDSKNETSLKIAAAPINPSLSQVIDYIKENQSNMFQEISPEGIENLKPFKSLGSQNNFKSVEILSSVDSKGNLALVAVAQREDGKGSYVALLSGPEGYISDNEGKFEQIFNSFSARDFQGSYEPNLNKK